MRALQFTCSVVLACASIAISLASGCATSRTAYWRKTRYGTWEFSEAELGLLPRLAKRNVLAPISGEGNQKVQVLVRARNLDEVMTVVRLAEEDDVYVTSARGQELAINIDQITGVQRVRYFLVVPANRKSTMTAGDVAEVALSVPMIPFALTTMPLFIGLDADSQRNEADDGKAEVAYRGMSKSDLVTSIGEPMEKYACEDIYPREVWVYREDQVLRGGRALRIGRDDGKVYATSRNAASATESCALLRGSPDRIDNR